MRKGCTLILNKFDRNTANDRASVKASPCTNSFREKRLSILASCMSNFHIVKQSSAKRLTLEETPLFVVYLS